jgi:hypothetical protein
MHGMGLPIETRRSAFEYPLAIKKRLLALNSLRCGRISSAYKFLTGEECEVSDFPMPLYEDGKDAWWQEINNLKDFLKEQRL